MKPLMWALVVVVSLLIQATLLPLVAVGGVKPDLLLLVVVSSGLLLGREHGVGMGFFAGLLQDLASGNIFGANVLSKMATGFVAGSMERKVFKENVLLPVLAVMAATVFNGAVMLAVMAILGMGVEWSASLAHTLFVTGYNVVLAIPVHQAVYRLARSELADKSE